MSSGDPTDSDRSPEMDAMLSEDESDDESRKSSESKTAARNTKSPAGGKRAGAGAHKSAKASPVSHKSPASVRAYPKKSINDDIETGTGTVVPGAKRDNAPQVETTVLQQCSGFVDKSLSKAFFRLGRYVGTAPYVVILAAVFVVAVCATGFTQFYQESRGDRLWIPQGTKAIEDRNYYESIFSSEVRFNSALMVPNPEGTNVLTKDFLNKAFDYYDKVLAIEVEAEGKKWTFETLCFKQGPNCLVSGILSKWQFNRTRMQNDADVAATVRQGETDVSLENSIGGTSKDSNGNIVSAKAMRLNFLLENREKVVNGDTEDIPAETWEAEYLKLSLNYKEVTIWPQAARSFSDEFGGTIRGDVGLLSSSYFLIIIYLVVMLGRTNKLESRMVLSVGAIASIGLAVAMGFGLSSWLGQFYGPVHSVLPFVLIGIGVDDSFVIFDAFTATSRNKGLPQRMGQALSHAGVSITVTSLTDFLAFVIGTTTVLPALSSFCVFAATSIIAVWLMQITFFSACIVLDERRVNMGRSDCCCCTNQYCDQREKLAKLQAEAEQNDGASRESRMQEFLGEYYTPFILRPYMRVIITVLFLGLLGGAIYCALNLEESADQTAFIPGDSYLQKVNEFNEKYFSNAGVGVNIVTKKFDYFANMDALSSIQEKIKDVPNLRDPYGPTFSSWFVSYLSYLNSTRPQLLTSKGYPATEDQFYTWLKEYLNGAGARFSSSVVYDNENKTAIKATRMSAEFDPLPTTAKQTASMNGIRAAVAKVEVPTIAFTFAFLNWEQYAVIEQELYQNIALAVAAVFLITLVMIGHPLTAILVTLCVVLTVVDLLGVMWLWNVPIDAVSAVNLVIAIGLAVDYSAHIGHNFMNQTGTRVERTIKAMRDIGASVINGAISTFLAIVLLSGSQSYVFVVFFKMFFIVAVFGVGHGLVLLPVALATFGPSPSPSAYEVHDDDHELDSMGPSEHKDVLPASKLAREV